MKTYINSLVTSWGGVIGILAGINWFVGIVAPFMPPVYSNFITAALALISSAYVSKAITVAKGIPTVGRI